MGQSSEQVYDRAPVVTTIMLKRTGGGTSTAPVVTTIMLKRTGGGTS